MAATFSNWSFLNLSVIFGTEIIEGFAEGDGVISVEEPNDHFTDIAGAKGDVIRTQSNDTRVTITLQLLQTSKSNAVLNTLHQADRVAGTGVLPMTLENKESGETYSIPNAWIVKAPTITRGQGPNPVEWTFHGDKLVPVITGAGG